MKSTLCQPLWHQTVVWSLKNQVNIQCSSHDKQWFFCCLTAFVRDLLSLRLSANFAIRHFTDKEHKWRQGTKFTLAAGMLISPSIIPVFELASDCFEATAQTLSWLYLCSRWYVAVHGYCRFSCLRLGNNSYWKGLKICLKCKGFRCRFKFRDGWEILFHRHSI